MKTTRILRLLSLLGFLLLLAPFYDSCEDKNNGLIKTYDEYDVNGKLIETPFLHRVYNIVVDELSLNAFQIAELSIFAVQDTTFREFKEEVYKSFKKNNWYKDLGVLISFLFDFIILISFSLFILSLTKKEKMLNKFALVNSILILITFLYVIFLESSFEHWWQIKWGYYAFIITNVLIFYYSKPNKITT
jgi:hypothetical protein